MEQNYFGEQRSASVGRGQWAFEESNKNGEKKKERTVHSEALGDGIQVESYGITNLQPEIYYLKIQHFHTLGNP